MDTTGKNAPLIEQRADPFVYKHTDGYYYFTGFTRHSTKNWQQP